MYFHLTRAGKVHSRLCWCSIFAGVLIDLNVVKLTSGWLCPLDSRTSRHVYEYSVESSWVDSLVQNLVWQVREAASQRQNSPLWISSSQLFRLVVCKPRKY